jgi:transposase InsO family protein
MFGVKMQIDVKFVPTINYRGQLAKDHKHSKYKLYQYTIIDMATNKVYRYAYDKHDANSTMDFIVRAIQFYGYIPKIIQTDNGREFTNKYLAKVGDDTQHPMDILCNSLGIQHKLIPPGRPQHNGKVERVHGTDQRRFYNYTSFDSLTDLNTKLATYNTYHNTIRTRVLRDRYGNMERYSPNQKEAELLSMLVEQAQEPTNKVQIRVALQLGTTAKHTYIDKLITLHTPRFCTQSELAKLLSTNNTT